MLKIKKSREIPFVKNESYSPRNQKERVLVGAFLKLKSEQEVANFLRDLLTLPEIEEFANRLQIARLLRKGLSYKKVAEQTGVSTTTVTRTAHWLFKGCGGYWKVLKSNIKK